MITREVLQDVADVDFTDADEVLVWQRKRRMRYTPDEAIALAQAILRVARDVKGDIADRAVLPHAFDVLPICRDCSEGKHGACIGSAFVESETEVEEVECGCAKVAHKLVGSAT